MSPQLLWTIAGLVLTVLTLGGVSISSYQSMDSATAKLVASEVGNVSIASKLWVANKSTDGTFNGITADAITAFIPDLSVTGVGASSAFGSKSSTGITMAVSSASPYKTVVVSVTSIPAAQTAAVKAALSSKACVVTDGSPVSTSLIYSCNG